MPSHEAQEVHASALVFDLHNDLLLTTQFLGWDWGRRHRANPLPGAPLMGHCDLPRLADGNMGCLALGIVTNPLRGRSGPEAIRSDLDRLDALLERHLERLVRATSPDAIRAARREGRIACLLGLEGAHGLDGRLELLPELRDRGLGYVGLCHFTANTACRPMVGWGSSASQGLTDFGRDLQDELVRLGIVVDVAHVNAPGVLEVCRRSPVPVICSHTAATAVFRSPRGLDDAQIRAIADTGGVVGVIFVTPFIGPGGVDAVVAHLEHIRRLVGIDHVGLGTDWEGFALYPRALDGADKLPRLTEALLRAGWSAEDVHQVYGENALRVWAQVQAAARA